MLVESVLEAIPMIELQNVSKRFAGKREVTALDNVDLEIGKGEFVSIVGPSGSGKSTMLNLVGGLDRPTSGRVSVDGAILNDLPDDDLTRVRRDKIGFIFQFFNLLPTLSALENVSLPLHLRGWPRKKSRERALELLGMVKVWPSAWNTCRTNFPEASASASPSLALLSINPPVILGDEPTGNLDTKTGSEVLALL